MTYGKALTPKTFAIAQYSQIRRIPLRKMFNPDLEIWRKGLPIDWHF